MSEAHEPHDASLRARLEEAQQGDSYADAWALLGLLVILVITVTFWIYQA